MYIEAILTGLYTFTQKTNKGKHQLGNDSVQQGVIFIDFQMNKYVYSSDGYTVIIAVLKLQDIIIRIYY